jgi:hypothetical protein
VSMICNGIDTYWLKVFVFTGAASGAAAIGQVTEGGALDQQTVTGTLTANVGNMIVCAATEWQASSPLSSTTFTIEQFDTGNGLSGLAGYKLMGTGAWAFASNAVAPRWTYAIAEIVAAGGGPPPDTTVIDPGSDIVLNALQYSVTG